MMALTQAPQLLKRWEQDNRTNYTVKTNFYRDCNSTKHGIKTTQEHIDREQYMICPDTQKNITS